jgi:hypothetical protein
MLSPRLHQGGWFHRKTPRRFQRTSSIKAKASVPEKAVLGPRGPGTAFMPHCEPQQHLGIVLNLGTGAFPCEQSILVQQAILPEVT